MRVLEIWPGRPNGAPVGSAYEVQRVQVSHQLWKIEFRGRSSIVGSENKIKLKAEKVLWLLLKTDFQFNLIFSQVHFEKSDQLVTSVNYYMYFAHLTNVHWGLWRCQCCASGGTWRWVAANPGPKASVRFWSGRHTSEQFNTASREWGGERLSWRLELRPAGSGGDGAHKARRAVVRGRASGLSLKQGWKLAGGKLRERERHSAQEQNQKTEKDL